MLLRLLMDKNEATLSNTKRPVNGVKEQSYFLSYSKKDNDAAHKLIQTLKQRGISIWIDVEGLTGGVDWPTELMKAIDECSGFLLLISPNSMESEEVEREVKAAVGRKKIIIPIVLAEAKYRAGIAYYLETTQRVSISDTNEIIRAIESLSENEPSPPPQQSDLKIKKIEEKLKSIRLNQPRLAFNGQSKNPLYGIGWIFPLLNNGGDAFELSVQSLTPLGEFKLSEDEVRRQEYVNLTFTLNGNDTNLNQKFPFILRFVDIDGNIYRQPSSINFGFIEIGKALPNLEM
jgi:hypothetical protein